MANPNSSGTAYTELATLTQVFGEDEAFALLAGIGANVNACTKSGSAPSKAATRGETGISIGFMHDMVNLWKEGFPLRASRWRSSPPARVPAKRSAPSP